MPARLEIRLKNNLIDSEGVNIKRKAHDYFGLNVRDVRVIGS